MAKFSESDKKKLRYNSGAFLLLKVFIIYLGYFQDSRL